MGNLDINPTPERAMLDKLTTALAGLMEIEAVTLLEVGEHPLVKFSGQLLGDDQDTIFEQLCARLAALGYTPVLYEEGGVHILQAVPGVVDAPQNRPWINGLLFIATLISVLFIGALNEGADPLADLGDLVLGLPFAGTLLTILTSHELSHYFVGLRYGSPVSLPYFIPLPLSIFGTMGALIVQRGPMRSRKALFDIGAAGPLGGLILALPFLVIGLSLSQVQPLPTSESFYVEGNSLLYFMVKYFIFGQPLPAGGVDVMLHPMAFAAWAGLLVTALNLFPIGQFDGGHIAYAMWGQNAWKIGRLFLFLCFGWGIALLVLGNTAGGTWITWGMLASLMGARHPAPLNDITPLDAARRRIGWAMVLIFVLILVPIPLMVINP
ncbi:MAG: site-2 protease family protein [Anaerolineae bacterium]|nr:site-2 protease family protein [Anaerolineae bacterium]